MHLHLLWRIHVLDVMLMCHTTSAKVWEPEEPIEFNEHKTNMVST